MATPPETESTPEPAPESAPGPEATDSPEAKSSAKSRPKASGKHFAELEATDTSGDASASWYRMTCHVEAQISVGTQNSTRGESSRRVVTGRVAW